MRIETVLTALGGVAPTHVLYARGIRRWEIARGIDEDRVIGIRRGVLALADAPSDLVTAVGEHTRLTCVSAARHYDLRCLREPDEFHLSRPDGVGSGFVNHRNRSVPVRPRLPLVGPVDVLVHVLQCRPEDESVPMVECALRRGDTVPAFLEARLPGSRNGRARAAPARVDCSADSAIEVVVRLLVTRAGPIVRPQVLIEDVSRVDFLVEGFLVVEVDGAAFHSDRRALRRDRHRNNMTIINGYTVLRFCYEDVMSSPDRVLAAVLAVLGRRPIR